MVSLKTLAVNVLLLSTLEAFQSRWQIRQRIVGGKKVDVSRYVSRGTSTSINAIANDGGEGDSVTVQINDNKSSLPTNENKSSQGHALLLFVALLYGTLNVTLRGVYATDGPPAPSLLSFVRQLLSLLAFVPILLASCRINAPHGDKPMWKSALELAQGLVTLGLLVSPAARASFLTQTCVVMTPLISALAGERIGPSVWSGRIGITWLIPHFHVGNGNDGHILDISQSWRCHDTLGALS